jgi:hypothetical protein
MGKKDKRQPQKQSPPADSIDVVAQEAIAQPESAKDAENDDSLAVPSTEPAVAPDSGVNGAAMAKPADAIIKPADAIIEPTDANIKPTDAIIKPAAANIEPAAASSTTSASDAAASPSPPEFKAKTTLRQDAVAKIISWIKDQKTLFDAFLVALSFHVVMFPVLWFAGWALPWPKPPVVTTIIEFDLQDWMKSGKPKKIIEFRDPELNQ